MTAGRRAAAAAACALGLLVLSSCGSSPPDLLVRPFDAGSDAPVDVDGGTPADAAPDADPDLGGPCADDAQCDDGVACTFDRCDRSGGRCRNVPDDTRCDDGSFCNGREACVRGRGCTGGAPVTCSDGQACTIDRCVEATQACERTARDQDGDGDPDDHCAAKRDCDDNDPAVSSLHAEVCGNGKDDDCDGEIDEAACVTVAGDTCASPVPLAAGATTSVSTVGANRDLAASCGVTQPTAARDVVGIVTVPPGDPKDLEVWATTPGTEVALAVQQTCGQSATELSCGAGPGATSVRTRARALGPGTYAVVVSTQAETSAAVRVSLLPPTPKPANESCGSAAPIAKGTPTPVALVDPTKDLPSACDAATGELVYSFVLNDPADVRVLAQTALGSGVPVVGLRRAPCLPKDSEIGCRVGSTLPLFARDLPAGTYYVTVAATAPADLTIQVNTSPPTPEPTDQRCDAPPSVVVNGTLRLTLADHTDAIKDGCMAGGPNAAYALHLDEPSDVLIVGRFPQTETGAVALTAPDCAASGRALCASGTTPVRAGKRGLPAGDYRVVVTDQLGQSATLTTLVRAAAPPTVVSGADTCTAPVDIPESGGFFTGDTTASAADFDDGCDAPNLPAGGAPDQILRLTLTRRRRVVLSTEGSSFATILDVRQGPACPGQPLAGGCYVGFGAARSFLDRTLDAGTYYVLVDGYALAAGAWNLDVRVVDP